MLESGRLLLIGGIDELVRRRMSLFVRKQVLSAFTGRHICRSIEVGI